MSTRDAQSGFILPVAVSSILVVAIIAGGMLSYISYGSRVAGVYTTGSNCRLSAQTALDQTEIQIHDAFQGFYKRTKPSVWTALNWFESYSANCIGLSGSACTLMQGAVINGATVTVSIQGVERSATSAVFQYADVTLRAVSSCKSPGGVAVTKTIEEVVEFALRRSSVFDHAYFVNNYGWFQSPGCTANVDVLSNGDLYLDSYSYINGDAYAAPNAELGAAGAITESGGGATRYMSQSTYWSSTGTWARPTNPTSADTEDIWAMGYNAQSSKHPYQEALDMPYLGDLSSYKEIAVATSGTIKQNGKVLVSGSYSGVGPSGIVGGADQGSLVLDGTSKPIIISGAVVVDGDVIIKGTVSGQGVIYAGRNIHVVGNVTYRNAPSWPKPDTSPASTVTKNASADLLGLCAKGNIVLGNYTETSWLNDCRDYITPPFVDPYTCDATDASIGYGSTFSGDYTANDSGKKVTYTYNSRTGKYTLGTANRKYYESSVGDYIVQNNVSSTAITEIDAVLYNNHAIMGKVGQCQFNGGFVCRNESCIYSTSVTFNWDSRLGSRSPDGIDFFIYLPMSVADPDVVSWREIVQ